MTTETGIAAAGALLSVVVEAIRQWRLRRTEMSTIVATTFVQGPAEAPDPLPTTGE
jgi:hypothetical protein